MSDLDPVLQRLELEFAGAHRDPAALWADVSKGPRYRAAPKHRARRMHWRPSSDTAQHGYDTALPSEPVEAEHANDSDTLLG